MKSKSHNWNQIHTVALKLGFRQVSSHENAFLYYQRPGSSVIAVRKSNVLTPDYVKMVLPFFGISYDDFVLLYKKSYQQ